MTMLGHRITIRGITSDQLANDPDLPDAPAGFDTFVLVEGEDLASGAILMLTDDDDHRILWTHEVSNSDAGAVAAISAYAFAARKMIEAVEIEQRAELAR